MKQRILYLDIIRIVACLMIIAMHAPIPNTGLSSYVLSADSFLTAPGIGLFIMVSGALLLPVNMSTAQFLKKRLTKIAIPTVLWTMFYYIVAPFTDTVNQGIGRNSFLSILFSPQFNGVLWFMYMLAGLYLVAPVLTGWLRGASRKEIEFYLCLWGVTMCYPLIRKWIIVNEGHSGILFYMSGYVGYFILGYYLKNYINNVSIWKCLIIMLLPLMIAIILKISHIEIDFYDLFGYLSIFVAMMAVALFLAFKRLNVINNEKSILHQSLAIVSNCCFGIYLVHIFVMRFLLWHSSVLRNLDGILQILVVSILTFILSFILIRLISYLPFSEYIIGCKYKK